MYNSSTALDKINPAFSANFLPLTSIKYGEEVSKFRVQSNVAEMRDEIKNLLERIQHLAALQTKKSFFNRPYAMNGLIYAHSPAG